MTADQQPRPDGSGRSRLGGAGRGMKAAGRGVGRASRYTVEQARRAARAEGAGDSGLSRLIGLHAFNAAGDAAVAISLAGTLFFQVPTGEARSQVALFLGLTMLPFAIVAPLIGPFLDRFSHGRRWAIGSTMAVRAFLCWVLATAVATDSQWLFPAALGVLIASKAYGVTRAAAVPRLLPPALTLVKANARVSLAGVVGATVSAPIAVLASTAGSEWSLRYAFVLFVVATVLAIRLPERVDSSAGEEQLALMPGPSAGPRTTTRPRMPSCGGLRPQGQLRAALAERFPHHVHGVPAPGQPDQRLAAGGAAGPGHRGGRAGQHAGHRPRLAAAAHRPRPDRGAGPGGRRRGRPGGGAVLRAAAAGAARASRRGSPSRWPSCRSTRPSSATCPNGSRPVRSRARTPPCSWRGSSAASSASPCR